MLSVTSIEHLEPQVAEASVTGEPISARQNISVQELWNLYRRFGETEISAPATGEHGAGPVQPKAEKA